MKTARENPSLRPLSVGAQNAVTFKSPSDYYSQGPLTPNLDEDVTTLNCYLTAFIFFLP